MKVLSAEQIRAWDEYTIREEPILSIDLMERASRVCANWILKHFPQTNQFHIFCGKGNNGGDGLAIARLLAEQGKAIQVQVLEFGFLGTPDFQQNLARLHQYPQVQIQFIQQEEHIHPIPKGRVVIDAIFGSGLNRALEGLAASLVDHINLSQVPVISIDMPSGMFSDRSSLPCPIINATYTLTFQCLKIALLYAENASYTGQIVILDIGLHPGFYAETKTDYEVLTAIEVQQLIQKRSPAAHKGTFGHALLLAGSVGKMGAAVLAARSALRSGLGLLTCQVPRIGNTILQSTVPEAMVALDKNEEVLSGIEVDLTRFNSLGIGPGIGQSSLTASFIKQIISLYNSPVILDADALNLIAKDPDILHEIPKGSIITPHPKEFERLFGKTNNDQDRISLALQKAAELNLIIVLKGYHSLIAEPTRKAHFNSTGNPGMATAGSGDVLTGILTGLLAQGYSPANAAKIGVFLHGLAGDLAAADLSQEAMTAGDVSDYLGKAWLTLSGSQFSSGN